MPKIHVPQLQRVLEVESGANLMRSLLKAGIPVASSCDGDCVCGKCKLSVQALAGEITPARENEKFLMTRLKIPNSLRLSCQVDVFTDITVKASYW